MGSADAASIALPFRWCLPGTSNVENSANIWRVVVLYHTVPSTPSRRRRIKDFSLEQWADSEIDGSAGVLACWSRVLCGGSRSA